jgi:hypothetical protein
VKGGRAAHCEVIEASSNFLFMRELTLLTRFLMATLYCRPHPLRNNCFYVYHATLIGLNAQELSIDFSPAVALCSSHDKISALYGKQALLEKSQKTMNGEDSLLKNSQKDIEGLVKVSVMLIGTSDSSDSSPALPSYNNHRD